MAFRLGDLLFEGGEVTDLGVDPESRQFPFGTECTCPGDCACRMPSWMMRFAACGCRQQHSAD